MPMHVHQPRAGSDAFIQLDNVSVAFPVYHGGSRSLKKQILFRGSAGRIGHDANQRIVIQALQNVSLTLKAGGRLALVGPNGAGKTTLLRVMAGIYEPTGGNIATRGRVSPMFDNSFGIDGDLSGYDNIRMRGLLLGMAPAEIEEKLPEIAEFTELDDYLEIPVRAYSSGMMLRLSFAVATCFQPEILLMDEWMLAGDAHFMAKAKARIRRFVEDASLIVLSSHDLELCRQWCSSALWLEGGVVRELGPIENVLASYRKDVRQT
jgi:ABC-type polysaccharide/polyol phosphate transport system ATPase subunit